MAKYKPGTKLLIELVEGESYEGIFVYGDELRLTLNNVAEYPSGIKVDSTLNFYKMEIASISVIDEVIPDNLNISSENSTPVIPLEEDKFEKLKILSRNNKYLAIVDNQFLEAIEYLKTCSEFAVFGLGSLFGRNAKISLLTAATKKQIYIFDVKLAQHSRAFEMGLKELFESKDILKIVHDSKTLSDCLYHSHKTKLVNVFDTQVADCMIRKRDEKIIPEKMRTFSECINNYLHIPKTVITNAEMNIKQLQDRPFSDDKLRNSALVVAYLHVLKDFLLNKILENYNQAVECYMNSMSQLDTAEARKALTYDLPDKFKQLSLDL